MYLGSAIRLHFDLYQYDCTYPLHLQYMTDQMNEMMYLGMSVDLNDLIFVERYAFSLSKVVFSEYPFLRTCPCMLRSPNKLFIQCPSQG